MQEAFRRALDELEQEKHAPGLDPRILTVLHAAIEDRPSAPDAPTSATRVARLVYRARRIAERWCSYARPNSDAPALLNALRDDWVVLVRQLGALSHRDRVRVLWEMACAMKPDNLKYDGQRFFYLTRRAGARPELFVGLTSSPHIPWPGPASFFVHAVEELEGASAEERAELHRQLDAEWRDQPLWLIHALASWVCSRHQNVVQ